MSETCHRGHKCMCFQCGERDCERYEPEPPKWIVNLLEDDWIAKRLKELELRGKDDTTGSKTTP